MSVGGYELTVVGPACAAPIAITLDAAMRRRRRACNRANHATGDCAADTAGYSCTACRTDQRARSRTLFRRRAASRAQQAQRQRRANCQCFQVHHLCLVRIHVIPRLKQRGNGRLVRGENAETAWNFGLNTAESGLFRAL